MSSNEKAHHRTYSACATKPFHRKLEQLNKVYVDEVPDTLLTPCIIHTYSMAQKRRLQRIYTHRNDSEHFLKE